MTRRVIEIFCYGPADRRHVDEAGAVKPRPLAQLVDGRTEPFAAREPQERHRDLVSRVLPDAPPVQIVGPPRHRIEFRRWTHAKGKQTFALAEMNTTSDGSLKYRVECSHRDCRRPFGGHRNIDLNEQTLERLFDAVCEHTPPVPGRLALWRVDLGMVEFLLRT